MLEDPASSELPVPLQCPGDVLRLAAYLASAESELPVAGYMAEVADYVRHGVVPHAEYKRRNAFFDSARKRGWIKSISDNGGLYELTALGEHELEAQARFQKSLRAVVHVVEHRRDGLDAASEKDFERVYGDLAQRGMSLSSVARNVYEQWLKSELGKRIDVAIDLLRSVVAAPQRPLDETESLRLIDLGDAVFETFCAKLEVWRERMNRGARIYPQFVVDAPDMATAVTRLHASVDFLVTTGAEESPRHARVTHVMNVNANNIAAVAQGESNVVSGTIRVDSADLRSVLEQIAGLLESAAPDEPAIKEIVAEVRESAEIIVQDQPRPVLAKRLAKNLSDGLDWISRIQAGHAAAIAAPAIVEQLRPLIRTAHELLRAKGLLP